MHSRKFIASSSVGLAAAGLIAILVWPSHCALRPRLVGLQPSGILNGDGIELWLVTNKPALPTGKILAELKLTGFFCEAISRDSQTPPFASKAEMLIDLLARNGMTPIEYLPNYPNWHQSYTRRYAMIRAQAMTLGRLLRSTRMRDWLR